MNQNRTIAIITARGGSKGLPHKNIALLGGKPLIAHSILAGRDCPAVARVVVTTDDPAIARVSREWGAEVIDRPAALATDTASSADAVRHAVESLRAGGETAGNLVLLQPTSPLRTAAALSDCLDRWFASGLVCAISVTEAEHSPYKAFTLTDGTLVPLFGAEYLSAPRQSLPPVYRQNGAIYAIKIDRFLETGAFYLAPALPYPMPTAVSVDIDTAADLALAEFLLSRSGGQT